MTLLVFFLPPSLIFSMGFVILNISVLYLKNEFFHAFLLPNIFYVSE